MVSFKMKTACRVAGSALLIALVAATAACRDDSGADGRSGAVGSQAATTAPTVSPSASYPALTIAANDTVLVPTLHGDGDTVIPVKIADGKYTIKVNCTGNGSLLMGAVEMQVVPCDGTGRRMHFATNAESVAIKLRTQGAVLWSVAVVDTPDFSIGPTKRATGSGA
jgi:hypothetical protein